MKRKTVGIPIRVNEYSNSSQIVSLLTRDHGLVDAIAKGAHRNKNAFQGCFDLAVLREVVVVERRRGAGLAILSESRVLDGYRGLRASWPRHAAASYVIEYLRVVAMPDDPAQDLFDLATSTLSALDQADEKEISSILLQFDIRALRVLGFLGRIDGCTLCGRDWPGRQRGAFFSVEDGGLVCQNCRRARPHQPATALSGVEVDALRTWSASSRIIMREPVEGAIRKRVHHAVSRGAVFYLERPLRMIKYSAAWL